MKKLIEWCLMGCLIGATPLWAQLAQSQRLEFKTSSSGNEYYDLTPLGEAGILVTQRQEEYYINEKWTFHRYDTLLRVRWITEFKLDYDLKPLLTYHNEDFAFWLFEEADSEKIRVLRLDLQTGETEIFKGNLLTKASISHFKVLGNTAFIGGYFHSRPVVFAFSFFDKTIKALPHLYDDNTEISNIEIDPKRNLLNVLLYTFKRNKCHFNIKTYNYEGRLLKDAVVNPENGNGLISGKILPLDENFSLLVGNYSQSCTQYSQGLYFSRIQDTELDQLQWVDFSKLENFFNYLKPKRKQRVIDKISKQKEEGKEPKFRYRLHVHDIIQTPNEFVLVAEVYYPVYHNAGASYGAGVRGFSHDFEGYRYTHAIVCGFDKTGNLLWDNCFAIQNVESYDLLDMVQVTQQGDLLVLGYPHEGKINTEVIKRSKVVQEPQEFEIKTAQEGDKVLNNDKGLLTAWYDRYFLAFGIQRISSEKQIGPAREVFYINKFAYDPTAPSPQPAATKENPRKSE
ncbi:MAG: hypothetical protein EAZ70_05175 [Runella slithyformis]|nr:MAG: hypothetical protein EAY79_04835 [Runella slithyformis]TAE99104.1 MAG: hypothetical protein EAZ80_05510 [Runella slithyformis]TAF28502.1 MAG: hypothetical protein EAZ70_05175 [Runella slithyformis]TAF47181.1 MAG: hypothetical protein EAZ63_08175 [Runella slithyformis]TAF82069.1 MAG: hypothetical protein EAZ50_04855 [Runella slithyformis]